MKTKKTLKPKQPADDSANPLNGITFPNFNNCSAQTGIPLATLRFASKKGCPAIENSSRVRLLPLLRWLFSQDEDQSGINWGDKLKEYQAKREKVKLDKDQKRSVDRDDIAAGLSKGMSVMFSVMDRKFKLELPPALKGLDESAIQIRLDEVCQSLQEGLRGELEKLAEEKGENK